MGEALGMSRKRQESNKALLNWSIEGCAGQYRERSKKRSKQIKSILGPPTHLVSCVRAWCVLRAKVFCWQISKHGSGKIYRKSIKGDEDIGNME